jgi:hypothetical protein
MNIKNDNTSSRCVVLVPLERIDAAHHVAQKFELHATFEHHPSLAMAEICLLNLQLQNTQSWNGEEDSPHLVLIHCGEMADVEQMLLSMKKYLPLVRVSELKDGRIVKLERHNEAVDSLEEPPIVQSESIDADELSMLLDPSPQEADEQ